MAKTVTGRSSGPLDVKRTQDARTRHALGAKRINGIFNGGATAKEIAEAHATRRVAQGQGPTSISGFRFMARSTQPISATRKFWTRAGRRAKTKAQRRARRANR